MKKLYIRMNSIKESEDRNCDNSIGLYRCTRQISHPNMGVLIRKGKEVEVKQNDNGTINAGGINLDPSFLDTHFEPVETRTNKKSRDSIEDIVMNYSSWSGVNGINDATDSAAYDLSLVGYTFNEVRDFFDAGGYYPDGDWDEEFANLILQKLRKLERNRTLESKKRPNKKSMKESYTPDLLDDLITQYESEYSAETHSNIWNEILDRYHDEELANDVLAVLEDGLS